MTPSIKNNTTTCRSTVTRAQPEIIAIPVGAGLAPALPPKRMDVFLRIKQILTLSPLLSCNKNEHKTRRGTACRAQPSQRKNQNGVNNKLRQNKQGQKEFFLAKQRLAVPRLRGVRQAAASSQANIPNHRQSRQYPHRLKAELQTAVGRRALCWSTALRTQSVGAGLAPAHPPTGKIPVGTRRVVPLPPLPIFPLGTA